MTICQDTWTSAGVFFASWLDLNTVSLNANNATFSYCLSGVAGLGRPSITFTNPSAQVDFRNYSGGLNVGGMGAGNNLSLDFLSGSVELLASNVGGAAIVRGDVVLTDNSTGLSVKDDSQNTPLNTFLPNADVPTRTRATQTSVDHLPSNVPTASANADAVWSKTLP